MAATKWNELSSFPSSFTNLQCALVTPTGINKQNYIVIGRDCIRKYDFITDTWLKLMDTPTDIPIYSSCQSTLDINKEELWVLYKNKLTHIYLNENRKCEINSVYMYVGVPGKCILINNKFSVIGGRYNNSIKQWNESNKQFTNITTIYDQMELSRFGLVYNKSTNCLLLFGGYDWYNYKCMDSIVQYNVTQNKWNKLSISLPKAVWYCECAMAIHNQYVLIFGGGNDDSVSDDIYIYSIKHKTLRTSKIKCPSKGVFSATTVNNEIEDEKTVFGFVRNEWKTSQIDDHYFPPYYLLKIMHAYYLNEFVYLLGKYHKTHWKMSTLDII